MAVVTGVRHTATGWWLEEGRLGRADRAAGRRRDGRRGDRRRRISRHWTAWQLTRLAPDADVVLLEAERVRTRAEWAQRRLLRNALGRSADAARACRGRARRRGVPGLRGRSARDRRLVRRAGRRCLVPGGADARVATTESQLGSWEGVVRACADVGAPEEVVGLDATEVRAPLRLTALPRRRALSPERHGAPGAARAGTSGRAARAGVRIHERTTVRLALGTRGGGVR